ncbi:MAG: hypothetical protein R3332_05510 [Pseudohongiellaceae bacterium]|nr:hypothetical protein [Pseudohongiellaceae bacterium]
MSDTSITPQPQSKSESTESERQEKTRRFAGSDPRRKSGIITILLSILPGLGHAYVGYYKRGFVHFAIYGCSFSLHTSDQLDALVPLTFFFIPFFWIFTQIDAYRRAMLYNLSLDGIEDAPLPDDFSTPNSSGSMIGGITLAVVGLIALSNTRFGISLDWIEDWWPIAPIALGIYLVYGALKEKSH